MSLRIANMDDQPFGEFDPDLSDAVRYGDLDRVSELLNAGADPNAVDSRGEHVLLIALRNEYGEIATKLITVGARTDSFTASGASPLWLASTLGLETTAKALVAVGAPVNEAANDQSTPLSAALQAGHWSLADFLRQQGGTILEQDEYHAEMDRSYAMPGFDFAAADTEEFRRTIAELGGTFNLKIFPARERPGIYVCEGEALHEGDNLPAIVRQMGYSLIYDRLTVDCRPASWLLFPTDDKYPIIREIGPHSDRSASDNQGLIWVLVDIDEDNPFELAGCGLTFVDVLFPNELSEPDELAEHLKRVSPATAEQFESVEEFSTHLATTRTVQIHC